MKINLDDIKLALTPLELAKAFATAAKKVRNMGTYPKGDEYGEMHQNGDISIMIDLENGKSLEVTKVDFADWEYLTDSDMEKIKASKGLA